MKKHCNTVAHNTSIWAFFLSISKLQQLFRFHFQGQLLHPSTSIAIQPTDVAFLPPKSQKVGRYFVCDLEHGIKTTALERCQKKNRLCGCWPSESFKSGWPWKNLLNHLFCCKILFFNTSTKHPPPKSPRLVSWKDNKNAAPPSEILRRRRCRLLEHGLHSALPVALLAGYIHDEWDVHQFFFLWSWNLKGNSPPSGRFWHKLQMQKQNWFTRAQKNKQNNPPSH